MLSFATLLYPPAGHRLHPGAVRLPRCAGCGRLSIGTVGAAAATTLVAATEGQLDKAVYNGKVEALAAEAV